MKAVVAVGQNNSYNCLIAKFDEDIELWSIDTSFPTINGKLWGVYCLNRSDFWVCGGTGNGGITSPILYHYSYGDWIDYSSYITDAVYLTDIDGISSSNIWTIGAATGVITTGAWNWDGSLWTSTKTNTLDFTTWPGDHIHISVSSDGHAWTCSSNNIFSNVSSPTWTQKTSLVTDRFHDVCSVSDIETYFSSRSSGNSLILFDGSSASYYKQPTPVSGESWHIDALTSEEIVFVNSDTVGEVYTVSSGVATLIGNAGTVPVAEETIRISYIDTNDIWICGPKYVGTWNSTPILTHYEGGTSWSTTTDYNVDSLNGLLWVDVCYAPPPPPYLISEPISPNPGYYLNSPITWKLGQD